MSDKNQKSIKAEPKDVEMKVKKEPTTMQPPQAPQAPQASTPSTPVTSTSASSTPAASPASTKRVFTPNLTQKKTM
jgi:hypothetical protein